MNEPFLITLGLSNLLALAGLIFRAGAIVNSIKIHDIHLAEIVDKMDGLSQEVNDLSQRVAHLEGTLIRRNLK